MALLARGADPHGAQATADHVYRRDLPLATGKFRAVFEAEGFGVEVLGYDDCDEPLASYTKMAVAWRPPPHRVRAEARVGGTMPCLA